MRRLQERVGLPVRELLIVLAVSLVIAGGIAFFAVRGLASSDIPREAPRGTSLEATTTTSTLRPSESPALTPVSLSAPLPKETSK